MKKVKRFKTNKKLAKPQLNFVEKAIYNTLRYRSIFNYPMTKAQIFTYLITNTYINLQKFSEGLDSLIEKKLVYKHHDYYSLENINSKDIEEIKKRIIRSTKLIQKAKEISKNLKLIPWIEMLAITGSVAAFNAKENADIDVLVVTKPKRLYLSRFFLVTLLKAQGLYWESENPAGKVCPNIFITSDNLTWQKEKQNLYVANEISLMIPVFDKNNIYFKFLRQNIWASDFLGNFYSQSVNLNYKESPRKTKILKIRGLKFGSILVDVLETFLRNVQIIYMKRKMSTEIVKHNFIHFNVNDNTNLVINVFNNPLDN